MSTLKTIGLWTSRIMFRVMVLLAIIAVVLANLLGSPENIKQILNNSGAYENIVDIVIDETTKQAKEDNSIPIEDEKIQKLFHDAFPPQRLQLISNQITDGTYRWLDGEVAEPDFEIDLKAEKTALAKGVADHAATRIEKLPACTSYPITTDPFKINCQPPGLDVNTEKQKIENEFLKSQEFLPNTTLTINDFYDNNNQSFNEQYSYLPDGYQLLTSLPLILGFASLFFGGLIVFLDKSKHHGINRVATILLSNGLFIFITTLIFGKLLPITDSLRGKFKGGSGTDVLNNVLSQSLDILIGNLLLYSSAVAMAGVFMLLALRFATAEKL